MVSNAQDYNFHPALDEGLAYVEGNPAVRDVLLSGGVPLLLSDRKMDYLLGRLRKIPHVEFIRIGSRIPVFLPQRITPELASIFRRHGPIWMSIHVNHPRECTQELKAACERLALAGVPLGNQSVLLRKVNDDVEVMKSLVHRLLQMRVRPYYLYQCDLSQAAPTSARTRQEASKSFAGCAATRRVIPYLNSSSTPLGAAGKSP